MRQSGDDRIALTFDVWGFGAGYWVKEEGNWRKINQSTYDGSAAGQTVRIEARDEFITVQIGAGTPIIYITDMSSGRVGLWLKGDSAISSFRLSPLSD